MAKVLPEAGTQTGTRLPSTRSLAVALKLTGGTGGTGGGGRDVGGHRDQRARGVDHEDVEGSRSRCCSRHRWRCR